MYAPQKLQWWFKNAWHQIGWEANDPDSAAALREHGEVMARSTPGRYRIIIEPLYPSDGPTLLWEAGS